MRPIQSAWPVRLFPVLGRTGKDPVLRLWISPQANLHSVQTLLLNRDRYGFLGYRTN